MRFARLFYYAFVAPFTAANNMLTPKMRMREYNYVITSMYNDGGDKHEHHMKVTTT